MGDSIRGIFFKKINNKSSRFISYNKIMINFGDVARKEVYVVSPIKSDCQYWLDSRNVAGNSRFVCCRPLSIDDISEMDVMLPLFSNNTKFEYNLGFIEDILIRESTQLKNSSLALKEYPNELYGLNTSRKIYMDKIE